MIYLTATTDKLQLVTSAASTVDVQANCVEAVTSGLTSPTTARQNTAISTAATTDILAAPGASNTRTLKQLTVRNKDASVANDVTLLFNANGTTYEIHKVTLQPGDSLIYIEGIGFFTNAATALLDKNIILKADVSNSTTSFADISGLTCPLLAGKWYSVFAWLHVISAATTTGIQVGYNIGAAPTVSQFSAIETVTNSATAAAMSTGAATARDTAIVVQTTGSSAIAPLAFAGVIQPSADGTFALRLVSEVAASGVTVKAGSFLQIRQER